jgi:hypothetical protein
MLLATCKGDPAGKRYEGQRRRLIAELAVIKKRRGGRASELEKVKEEKQHCGVVEYQV